MKKKEKANIEKFRKELLNPDKLTQKGIKMNPETALVLSHAMEAFLQVILKDTVEKKEKELSKEYDLCVDIMMDYLEED